MDFIQIYAGFLLGFNLITTIVVTTKLSGAEGLTEEQESIAKRYAISSAISFFATLPIYMRAAGIL